MSGNIHYKIYPSYMSFNLDILTYNIRELEDLFSLSPSYTTSDVLKQSDLLKENIMKDNTINAELKQNTIEFIIQGTDVLCKKSLSNDPIPITNIIPQTPYAPVPVMGNSHELQQRPATLIPYTMSYPQEFFTGTLNPLQKRVIRRNLNIDTRFRDNYSNSIATNCYVNLSIPFISVLSMQLSSIEIPNSFYVISKQYGNNFFSISAGNEKIVYIIPDGNYTNNDLIDFLNNYAVNNGYTPTSNPLLYYMSFVVNISGESGSGQVVIGVNSSYPNTEPFLFTVNFGIDINGNIDKGTPLQMKFGWLLGYRNAIYENGYAYVSEGMIDLYGPRYLYLAIDDYNNNVNNGFYGAYASSVLNKNILARMTLPNSTKTSFNIYNWNITNLVSYPRQYFGPVNTNKFGIQLLDEYGRTVYLNNMDFSFCLTFEMVYDL